MRVVLSDPSIVDELVVQLRHLAVDATRDGSDAVRIVLEPPAPDEPDNPSNQDEVELTFAVRACLRHRPDASFRVESC